MRFRSSALAFLVFFVSLGTTHAQTTLTLDGVVPDSAETHFFVPFEVPAGTVEIEVRHDDLSEANILDWGLEDTAGFRGWGGGNVEPAIVGIDAASRSYVPGPIPSGTWRVVVGKAKLAELPANYHLEIVLRTGATLAPQPERRAYAAEPALETGYRWYRGDFHVHSRESGDAAPSLDAIASFATVHGLDFVAISDHNTLTALDFVRDVRSRHPGLLFVPNVEFTTYAGHANAIGATTWVDHRIGVEGATIGAAFEALHAQGAFVSINHPSLALGDQCIGCAWDQPIETGAIDGIELQTTGTEIVKLLFLEPNLARWESMADEGHHVTPLGGSDDHRGGEGTGGLDSPIGTPTTFVYAPELSVSGILAGLRAGRTAIGLEGPDSPEVVLGSADLADDTDTIHARSTRLTIDVHGGREHTLVVFRNGEPYGERTYLEADDFHTELRVRAPATGEDRYRVELIGTKHPATLTGHVYLTRIDAPPAPPGGCSTSPVESGLVAFALGILLASLWLRRSR